MKRGPKPLPTERKRGKNVGVACTDEEYDRWHGAAERERVSLPVLIRRLLEEFLDRRHDRDQDRDSVT